MLLTHQRQAFNDALALAVSKSSIRPYVSVERTRGSSRLMCIHRFDISVRGLDWVANQERTRWFLVLRIEPSPKSELARLLQISNEIVKKFGQQPLYEEPRLLSSASRPRGAHQDAPGQLDKRFTLRERRRGLESGYTVDLSSRFHISIGWSLNPPPADMNLTLRNGTGTHNMTYEVHISAVKVKIGNGVTAYSLPSKVETSNGIIGI